MDSIVEWEEAVMSELKQSACDWCFFKKDYEPQAYYRRLKEIGYSGVEMVDPTRWNAARAAGLEIINLAGPGMKIGLNRSENHAQLIPELKKSIATAAANHIPGVIIFSGNRTGLPNELGIKNCIEGIKQVIRDAESAGVVLLFEVLNSFDHVDYQSDHSSFAFSVVKAVSSPSLKVLYDVYHMQRMGESLSAVMLGNLPHIGHLHIAGSPRRDFPGPQQEIDYQSLIPAVCAEGYDGYWGHEFLPGEDGLDELARSYALFQACSHSDRGRPTRKSTL